MDDQEFHELTECVQFLEEQGAITHADALSSLLEVMKPTSGDDPIEAKKRELRNATCGNCGHTWGVMAAPSELLAVANTVKRLCKCARCFETRKIYLS